MGLKFKNNAFGTLAAPITAIATAIPLTAGHGARFPVAGGGDYFYATLVDVAANLEIVKVVSRTVDTLTVLRGQDGFVGRAYIAGDRVELRPCNIALLAQEQEGGIFITAAGTGTYSATLDPVPTAYNTNQIYWVRFANTNAAPVPTLNLNSFGPKTIKRSDGLDLAANEIIGGWYSILLYDGINFILINTLPLALIFTGKSILGGTYTDGTFVNGTYTGGTSTDGAFVRPTVTNPANVDQTLTDGATVNWDMDLGGIATLTLGAAGGVTRIMAPPTHLKKGTYVLHLIQLDTTARGITWDAVFKWSTALPPVLSSGTAGRHDIISIVSDGAFLYSSATLDLR